MDNIEEKASDAGLDKAADAVESKTPDKADGLVEKGEKAADAKIGE